jgi:hypothetical protein
VILGEALQALILLRLRGFSCNFSICEISMRKELTTTLSACSSKNMLQRHMPPPIPMTASQAASILVLVLITSPTGAGRSGV